MRGQDLTTAFGDVGKKWTRQVKAEEKRPAARNYRTSMWASRARKSLREICFERMEEAWDKASDGSRLPTHWRQIFYVIRPLCDGHPESDRELRDETFKNILEDYLKVRQPGWDVLRGARGVFKEPHRAKDDNGLAMSTMNVRDYLGAQQPDGKLEPISVRFPTAGARNRIAAVLICEKEGFDELLEAEGVQHRFDLALMSTKGISALAARDLAESLGVPCFTLHDLDKNGFVMASGFPHATDLGIRMEDVEEWDLAPEGQYHKNPEKTYENLLRNGATEEEAEFISGGERVELNMLSGRDFIEFVQGKLREHGVEKVVPDDATLAAAWKRAHQAARVNRLIRSTRGDQDATTAIESDLNRAIPTPPDGLADRIRDAFEDDDTQSWDEALYTMIGDVDEDDEEAGA